MRPRSKALLTASAVRSPKSKCGSKESVDGKNAFSFVDIRSAVPGTNDGGVLNSPSERSIEREKDEFTRYVGNDGDAKL